MGSLIRDGIDACEIAFRNRSKTKGQVDNVAKQAERAQTLVMMGRGVYKSTKGFFYYTPEAHVAFCPILSTHFFPCLNPTFKNGSFFVRRRPCVCDIFRFESPPPAEKRSNLAQKLNFPNVKNDAGQKQHSPCFLGRRRPATPSQEHGLCPPWGFSRLFC